MSGMTLARNGTGIQVTSGTATIMGNTISGGATGIVLSGGTATVSGNTIAVGTTGIQANAGVGGSITNNTITTAAGGNALNMSAGYLGTISGNTASGGGFNGISVAPGPYIIGAATWAKLGLPYVVSAGTGYGNGNTVGLYGGSG